MLTITENGILLNIIQVYKQQLSRVEAAYGIPIPLHKERTKGHGYALLYIVTTLKGVIAF